MINGLMKHSELKSKLYFIERLVLKMYTSYRESLHSSPSSRKLIRRRLVDTTIPENV